MATSVFELLALYTGVGVEIEIRDILCTSGNDTGIVTGTICKRSSVLKKPWQKNGTTCLGGQRSQVAHTIPASFCRMTCILILGILNRAGLSFD
jgi:hypothetical protein